MPIVHHDDAIPHPAWWFPTPVRTGTFLAADPAHARFNIEVAPDRLAAFALQHHARGEVLHFDLQTQLTGNSWGRLGSGRGGVFQGHYLKGVGRTPAAANWNQADDLYHASGHLSVASALRERLITAFLRDRGLEDAIVPCEAVLLRKLSAGETRAIRQSQSSSRPAFNPADATLAALTVKPADFARLSNFVFALDHFEASPRRIGELFLDLERFLNPPLQRSHPEGTARSIVAAMDGAFHRGLDHFQKFARVGLFWLYLDSNFSLDGRFLDLETPLYLGQPFVGMAESKVHGDPQRELLGFEEFEFVRHWRLFIAWLRARLRFMTRRDVVEGTETRVFLGELARELSRVFGPDHLLHRDDALIRSACRNLAPVLGLDRADRRRLHDLARFSFTGCLTGRARRIPDCGWQPVTIPPAEATPRPRRLLHAAFSPTGASAEGVAYNTALTRLSAITDPRRLLVAMQHPTKVGCS